MRSSRRFGKYALLGRVGLLAALAITVGAGMPHLGLKSSNPEDGSMISEWPKTVELTFTGPVDAKMSRVVLKFGDTDRRLDALDSPDRATLVFAIPDGLGSGAAELDWLATGSDGHPVDGVVRFHVGTHDYPQVGGGWHDGAEG